MNEDIIEEPTCLLSFAKKSKVNVKPQKRIAGSLDCNICGVVLEFQSIIFNNLLFNLRQTGILVLDLRGDDRNKVTKEEAIYCISKCSVLFCPVINVRVMEVVIRYFTGSKLVLCSGVAKSQNSKIFEELLHEYLYQRSMVILSRSNEINDTKTKITYTSTASHNNSVTAMTDVTVANSVGFLSLQISNMGSYFNSSYQFAHGINSNIYSCIRELMVDSASFGILGICLLLHAMKVIRFM